MIIGAKAAETLAAALFGVAITSGAVRVDHGTGLERPVLPVQQIEAPAAPVIQPQQRKQP